MKTIKALFILLSVFLFVQLSYQECHHDKLDIELADISDEDMYSDGNPHERLLATTTFSSIRVLADFTYFTGTAAVKTYIKEKLLPAAANYFSATLKVPRLSKLKTTAATVCGLKVPTLYKNTGVDGDIVFFVTGEKSADTWLAWAKPCATLSSTGRPIFGQINFNLNDITASSSDKQFESNLMVVMHEMTHVFGVSQSLFSKFPNKATVSSRKVGANTRYYVDIAPLTQRLRTYFGCSTLPGAYLENQGGSGSAGSHFERRFFMNEYMTASAVLDSRITQFTLALLEGSGWYQVNYAMTDKFEWGKGEGCSFFEEGCTSTNANEFCTGSGSYGCTNSRSHGGYCSNTDTFGDFCYYVRPYTNLDCEDSAYQASARITGEFYGKGSKCFMGTLYSGGALKKPYPYCLKNTCEKQTNGKYFLKVTVGKNIATCKAKGNIAVAGYSGVLDCPDPNEYCQTIGVLSCPRGCMGKGVCKSGKCTCYTGWRGNDCGIRITENLIADYPEYAPPLNPDDIQFDNENDNEHN